MTSGPCAASPRTTGRPRERVGTAGLHELRGVRRAPLGPGTDGAEGRHGCIFHARRLPGRAGGGAALPPGLGAGEPARDAQHDNRGTLDLARSAAEARVAFMAGQSITLNHLQRFLDPRHRLMDEFRRLSRLTGCASGDVQLAAFHSAANGRAFGAHTDPNHVFVVQLVGEKVWVIGPEDDEQRIVLGPGDTLYLPYGHRHSVSAGEQKTLSLSFIVRPTSWSDVLLDAYAQRLRRSPWGDPAAALPWGWIDVDPRDIALEPAGIGPLDRDDVVSSLDTRAGDTLPRLPADAQLVMSDPGEAVGPATTVVRGWDSRLRVTPHGPHARIAAAGRASLVCPREVADLLRRGARDGLRRARGSRVSGTRGTAGGCPPADPRRLPQAAARAGGLGEPSRPRRRDRVTATIDESTTTAAYTNWGSEAPAPTAAYTNWGSEAPAPTAAYTNWGSEAPAPTAAYTNWARRLRPRPRRTPTGARRLRPRPRRTPTGAPRPRPRPRRTPTRAPRPRPPADLIG